MLQVVMICKRHLRSPDDSQWLWWSPDFASTGQIFRFSQSNICIFIIASWHNIWFRHREFVLMTFPPASADILICYLANISVLKSSTKMFSMWHNCWKRTVVNVFKRAKDKICWIVLRIESSLVWRWTFCERDVMTLLCALEFCLYCVDKHLSWTSVQLRKALVWWIKRGGAACI